MAFELDVKSMIGKALDKVIADAREEVIKDAVKEFETQVRASVAHVTLKIFEAYSVERIGNQILIRVDIKGDSPR
jgi:hypothetical protein